MLPYAGAKRRLAIKSDIRNRYRMWYPGSVQANFLELSLLGQGISPRYCTLPKVVGQAKFGIFSLAVALDYVPMGIYRIYRSPAAKRSKVLLSACLSLRINRHYYWVLPSSGDPPTYSIAFLILSFGMLNRRDKLNTRR